MPLVDWKDISPAIDVVYSSLENPSDCDDLDSDVAALKLPSGYGIDVSWNDSEGVFVLRLFLNSYKNSIVEAREATAAGVIEQVDEWVRSFSAETSFERNPIVIDEVPSDTKASDASQ